jgi:hypothetical protein
MCVSQSFILIHVTDLLIVMVEAVNYSSEACCRVAPQVHCFMSPHKNVEEGLVVSTKAASSCPTHFFRSYMS